MKRLLMTAGLALALCACLPPAKPDGEPRMTEAEQIRLGCQGAELTVVVLDGLHAELERELTPVQLRVVAAAKDAVLTICDGPPQSFEVLRETGYAEAVELLTRELATYLARKNAKPQP